MWPCCRSAGGSFLSARSCHYRAAALHQSGLDNLRADGRADAGCCSLRRGLRVYQGREPSRRGDEPSEDGLPARPLRKNFESHPGPRSARGALGRGRDQGPGHREGHRPLVGLPVGDLGIVTAVQRVYRLRKKPTPERLRKIGEAWRPYRSVASWYLWRSLDNEPVATSPPPKISKRA